MENDEKQRSDAVDSASSSRRSALDPRRRWLLLALFLPFAASVFGAYAWFNTDIGRSDSQPSTLDPQPRIWLTAKTNIEGYLFVPEPVSVEVRKILGGTKRDDSRCLER